MEKTVVGVDDPRGARATLAWAAHHAAAMGGRLRVVHAYELPVAWIDVYAPELPVEAACSTGCRRADGGGGERRARAREP